MKWIALGLLGFFALIGLAMYVADSAWPLLALLLMPNMSTSNDDEESK